MSLGKQKRKILSLLLRLYPEMPGLRWDNAVLLERQGHNQLIQGNRTEALRLYLEGIAQKRELLSEFTNTDELEKKRLSLINSCFHLASIYRSMECYSESEQYLYEVIEIIQTATLNGGSPEKYAPLLQRAYKKLAILAPWVVTYGNISLPVNIPVHS